MKNNVQNQLVKQKYDTLYNRVSKAIQKGKFSTYTNAKKQNLLNRLKRYERRLKHWGIAVASAAALFLSPTAVTAQTPSGSEFQVNTYTTYYQVNASVAMDADGDFVVVWQSHQDGWSEGIYAQRYNSSGVTQGSEFQVNTYTSYSQTYASVAMDSDGDFVVAWQSYDQDGGEYGVYAQRYNSSGVAQGSEFQVNTYTSEFQSKPSVAMDSDGDFVIAWNSYNQDGSAYGIYAQRYNSSGVAQGSEFQVNTITSGNQSRPSVAMDSDGDFVIAWNSNVSGVSTIRAQRYNNSGVAQGTEFQVNTTINNADVSVAMDSDGDFVATWIKSDGNGYGVYAQRYNSSGVVQGTEFQVNTYTTSHQRYVEAAMDSDGDFVVTWSSNGQDGSSFGVYAQRYNSSGVAQDTEFRANTYTTSSQTRSTIAMDNDGDYVIAWDSYGQDGDYHGIFAQRYTFAALPVELTNFTAKAQENQTNLLEWETASEENNAAFEIEKSVDGQSWEKIGTVEGNGTTIDVSNYSFIDETPFYGINYYRLKQLDFDGQFEYSEIEVVERTQSSNTQTTLYPTPVQDVLTVDYQSVKAETMTMTIVNITGQVLMTKEFIATKGDNQYKLDLSDFVAGNYFVQIKSSVGVSTNTIIKQ